MSYWLDVQDHIGSARGWAPFSDQPDRYTVYRNAVRDNGARNDGTGDQAGTPGHEGPLQRAINDEYYGSNSSRYQNNTTHQPRVVFLPGGVYQIKNQLDLRLNTVLVGDPNDPPVIQASPDFQGNVLVNGSDYGASDPTTCFMILVKNIIIDTTQVPSNRAVTALHWSVAQGCGLSNVTIKMPLNQNGNQGHTGILMDRGSPVTVADVNIIGGLVGISFGSQQAAFKGINFTFCTTAFAATGGYSALIQKATFNTVGLCADISVGSLGNLVLLDCTAINSGPAVKFRQSQQTDPSRNNQIAIQNLTVKNSESENPVVVDDWGSWPPPLANTSYVDTWLCGNVHPGVFQNGLHASTKPSAALLGPDGTFFTKAQPKYDLIPPNKVVNVKSVPGHPVEGNGWTDDSASLNAILLANAASGSLTYFPYGVYIVKSTLFIPPGTRIVGEAWPVISGSGPFFQDETNPQPIVQIGSPHSNEVGICEISEMRFTVAEILPGAKILEINLSGAHPGDVALWNTIITIGGTLDSQVTSRVSNQDTTHSKAAFLTLHLTPSSSTYIENLWSWTADHCLDSKTDNPPQIISTGRGLLCQSTNPTWLIGTSIEHHWLYQYNFAHARNVFAGLLHSESPYMQGTNAVLTVPQPWTPSDQFADPDYSSFSSSTDQPSRVALAVNIQAGSDLYFYNGAHWAFFTGVWDEGKFGPGNHHTLPYAQTNMIRVSGRPERFVWYGIATKQAQRMILDGQTDPLQFNNPGGWMEGNNEGGGLICAYRVFA